MGTLAMIALRNLNRQKKRSILLGGAIAFGILIVTVINGFAGAFQENVAGNMAQLFAGHVFVEGVEKTAKGKAVTIIRDDSPIMAALAEAGIDTESGAKRSAANATLVFEGKKTTQNIYGADLLNERYLRERLVLKSGTWENMENGRALILNDGVAKKLKIEVGDRLLVQLKTVTGQNNLGEFTLAGISQDMGLFSSMLAYAHREYLNELLNIAPQEYQMFGLLVDDLSAAEATAAALVGALKKQAPVFELPPAVPVVKAAKAVGETGAVEETEAAATSAAEDAAVSMNAGGPMRSRYQRLVKLAKDETWEGTKFRVFTINDMLSQIEELVRVLNLTSTIILLVLFLIIMVGITNTFRMIMYERIKEIGTMRALGIQRGGIRSLFLLEASFLGIGGAVAGWLAAAIIMGVLSLFSFGTDTVFALLLKNGHLSFSVPVGQSLFNFFLVLALTLVAAILPARAASRLEPAQALRTSK